jgi:hypothetical protein
MSKARTETRRQALDEIDALSACPASSCLLTNRRTPDARMDALPDSTGGKDGPLGHLYKGWKYVDPAWARECYRPTSTSALALCPFSELSQACRAVAHAQILGGSPPDSVISMDGIPCQVATCVAIGQTSSTPLSSTHRHRPDHRSRRRPSSTPSKVSDLRYRYRYDSLTVDFLMSRVK